MTVRPFDWRDLPALYRYRHQSVFLDSALVLTRGAQLVPGAIFSYLAPAMGIFTGVSNGRDCAYPLIGQTMHLSGAQTAHLTFLTPTPALELPVLAPLLDYLIAVAGSRGAFRLLAEVDEQSLGYEALRQSSFAIYSRQRLWQLTALGGKESSPAALWRPTNGKDTLAVRLLYNNLVPGLVQQVEPFPEQGPRGLIYQQGDDLLGYIELKYGHRGIWVQPFLHPDVQDVAEKLVDLFENLPNRRSRPIYICVRSYQSWLESALEDLGAEAGPRQAVMVKHLAVPQKASRAFALPALEGGHPEVSAPIARSESK